MATSGAIQWPPTGSFPWPPSRERDDGLTTAERDELRRLRKENARLKQERDLLKRAAAFFAKDSDQR